MDFEEAFVAMGQLSGKTALVAGLANERSLAYVIAKELEREGARLVITYQSAALQERVQKLADTLTNPLVLQCDVGEDAEIDALFATVKDKCGGLDGLVHAIAYAEKEDLAGAYYTVSRRGFHTALDVGCYSFTALARGAAPLMEARGGGAMLTLSYFGAEKVIPHYNIMGVTKAALEASVRYLAADLGRSRRCRPRVSATSARC
jgi:enoyl-[acyl-carrier protein] reductase I